MATSELKPCPFCGSESIATATPCGEDAFFVEFCTKCGGALGHFGQFFSKEAVIAAWNQRVGDEENN